MQRVLFLIGKAASDRRGGGTAAQQAVRVTAFAGLFVAVAAAHARADNFTVSGVSPGRSRGLIEHAERVRSEAFSTLLGRAWSVRDLLSLEDYPPGSEWQRVFYGQSAAVVRWLVARRDAATFIRFLDDAAAHGTEAALASHYGLDSTAALAQAWEKPSDMCLRGLAAVPR